MKKPAVCWSLMHPTPLNIEYMKEVVKKAASYHVDSFEICADCHTPMGGMEGIIDYAPFPVTAGKIDMAALEENRKRLREILNLAHSINKPVFYWHREAVVPEGLLSDMPDLLDENGEFDLLGEAYAKLLRYKIDATFKSMPELDGLVLTLTEASYSVIHSSNPVKYPPVKVVEHVVRLFAAELQKLGKTFILRSFGSIAQDYEDILAGAKEAAKDFAFEVETKITPYDFDPFLPINPFLRKLPGATLGAECDCLGEFLGAGFLPAENIENIVSYVRTGEKAGVDRYAIRLDRIGNRVLDCYEINLYAYERAIHDPHVTAEEIRKEYLEKTVPPAARELFAKLGPAGLELVKKTNFIDGNVIFHQFPPRPNTKYLKAGFIFALFNNGADLHNGYGVWSILSENKTPGRDRIIQEKEEAFLLAKESCKALEALEEVPGFEAEFAWRKRLWNNAKIASGAFLSLTKCIAAYFDDMEENKETPDRLLKAVEEGRKLLEELSGEKREMENSSDGGKFINGLERNLFFETRRVKDVYITPFYGLFDVLLEEYKTEFAMRKKYLADAFDGILCGAITFEGRCARYMHGCHVSESKGGFYRFAGNTVFPNGYLDMALAVPEEGGKLLIYGDTEETNEFTISIDGAKGEKATFDAEGKAEFSLPAGKKDFMLRLTKAPGVFFPRFHAVIVEKK